MVWCIDLTECVSSLLSSVPPLPTIYEWMSGFVRGSSWCCPLPSHVIHANANFGDLKSQGVSKRDGFELDLTERERNIRFNGALANKQNQTNEEKRRHKMERIVAVLILQSLQGHVALLTSIHAS